MSQTYGWVSGFQISVLDATMILGIFAISYIYFQRKESVEVENRDFNDQCISWKLGS